MLRKSSNNFFMNFANKAKLDIIMSLKEKPMCVNEIIEKVGGEQSAVSHNLRKLEACHILNVEKKGRKRIYSLNKDTVIPMLKLVEKHVRKHCFKRWKK